MITYAQAYKDHSYLWAIAPADDMTGAYVDQEDLEKLLAMPTKATARDCLVNQIEYWFERGPDRHLVDQPVEGTYESIVSMYPEVEDICERYSNGFHW